MGHHIDTEGRFQSDKYPELGPDKIVVSFRHPEARRALYALADGYRAKDPGFADDILGRLRRITADEEGERRRQAEAAVPPVDRSQRVLTDGRAEEQAPDYRDIKPETGQQKSYVVLSAEERAKGFVRPVRQSYRHAGKDQAGGCGVVTTMSRDIAETYARDPKFYGGTFCVGCKVHLPLDEFRWDGTDEVVGS